MAKPDIYIQPANSKIVEIIRITWILLGVTGAVAIGLALETWDYFTGKEKTIN